MLPFQFFQAGLLNDMIHLFHLRKEAWSWILEGAMLGDLSYNCVSMMMNLQGD